MEEVKLPVLKSVTVCGGISTDPPPLPPRNALGPHQTGQPPLGQHRHQGVRQQAVPRQQVFTDHGQPHHRLQSLVSNFVSHCFCCWSALLPQLETQQFSAEPIAGVEGVLTLPRWKAVWRGHGARDASPGRRRRRPCYLSPVRARPTKGPVPPAWHAPAYDSENTQKPPEPPLARFHNWFLLS